MVYKGCMIFFRILIVFIPYFPPKKYTSLVYFLPYYPKD